MLKESLLSTRESGSIDQFEPEVCYLDLANPSSIEESVGDILKITNGRLDILVNNAGMSVRGSCEDTILDVHRQLMEVNYFGHVMLTQMMLKPLVTAAADSPNSTSCIVCISSVQGRISIPYRSAYAASKHAFQAYFDSLRAELSTRRIKVLVVSPGYIQTNLSINALTATGGTHGEMDDATEKGMTSDMAAKRVLDGLLDGRDELILAPLHVKLAILIRSAAPGLYFWIMRRRAAKEA